MQVVWFPPVIDDRYVTDRAWEIARLEQCPFHPEGGCRLEGLGSYARVEPKGARIRRFLCCTSRRSISLLPAFLAAKWPGTLDGIEQAIDAVESASSMASAADSLRPADAEQAVTSISALRWTRRRVQSIRTALLALVTLMPELVECRPTLSALRDRLGVRRVLVTLRKIASSHIDAIARPLGLCAREKE